MLKQEEKMEPLQKTKPCVFSAKDAEAMKIYKQCMAKASVPSPTSSQIGDASEITPRSENYDQLFENIKPTNSQIKLQKNKFLCACHCLLHCGKVATLHKYPCNFCHGFPPGGPPHILRYYPEDEGWWTLRHRADRLRELAGLEKLNEIIPITANPANMHYFNYHV